MKIDRELLTSKKDKLQIKLKPYIIYRYEPLINNGALFIYNKKTGKIFVGNYLMYDILRTIKEQALTIKLLFEKILKNDNNLNFEELIEFLIELKDKDMIMISS